MYSISKETPIGFADGAAVRAMEDSLDLGELVERLKGEHFAQEQVESYERLSQLRHVHFLRVSGKPVKVVTAPHAFGTGVVVVAVIGLDSKVRARR
jgi:hypothetical protein